MKRRDFLKYASAAPVLATAPALLAQESTTGFKGVIPEQTRAIDRGLKFLAKSQNRSGAIGTSAPVAFTSLAGLAFLASGSSPRRGSYAEQIKNTLEFILKCTARSGYINEGSGRMRGGSGMHGHGFAVLFLAELYGMEGETDEFGQSRVRDALEKSVKVIENSQDRSGGWSYEPKPSGHEGSVTVTQVQALRAARNVGIKVGKKVIEKGIGYIKKTSNKDGSISYSMGSRGRGRPALTAAGMCVFNYLGMHDAPEVKRGMKNLMKSLGTGKGMSFGHYYYALFYAAQALYFYRNTDRAMYEKGYDILRRDLLQKQTQRSGAWGANDSYGGAYGTACAVLALQVPYKMLSIFEI